MNAVDTAIAFTAAWLAAGLGLFLAARSFRAIGGAPVLVMPLLATLGVLALGLVAIGLVAFVRVVPW
jgi:hypothetical protein